MSNGCVRLLAALWLSLALAGCGEKTPGLPRLAPSDVVVAFGDSLTYGTGAAESESYPAVLGQLTGRTIVRAGVPGEVTAQGLARLPAIRERIGLDVVGVIGPTRLNYARIVPIVDFTAQSLGKLIATDGFSRA